MGNPLCNITGKGVSFGFGSFVGLMIIIFILNQSSTTSSPSFHYFEIGIGITVGIIFTLLVQRF
jgi:hypothetical protein